VLGASGQRAPRPFAGEAGAIIAAPRPVQIVRLNHVAVKVQELSRPEAFYTSFFGMTVFGRAYRDPDGGFQPAPDAYDHHEAARQGNEADASFLQGGPLTLVLLRAGRDALIDPNEILGQISIAVDSRSFVTIRSETLIRNFEIFYSSDIAITFRDPFGITWEVTAGGTSH
jgi:catechol 2,3-dioxygenase-like lactoylglutathione lyase family enzyme